MKSQLTINEKLWELRKDRNLDLKDVAAAVGISASALSNYENKEYRDISISILAKLAKYYDVSLDWLAGLTETKDINKNDISDLHLDDRTIDVLKNSNFNKRLLCEIIKHPDFISFMVNSEIYIDGIATTQIKTMNDWVDYLHSKISNQFASDQEDYHLKILEASRIREEDYFFPMIHRSLDQILTAIREAHQYDMESAPIEPQNTLDTKKLAQTIKALKYQSNPVDAFWKVFCDQLDINYDKLSEEEHQIMKSIFNKSKLLYQIPNHKRKGKK